MIPKNVNVPNCVLISFYICILDLQNDVSSVYQSIIDCSAYGKQELSKVMSSG